MSLAQIEKVFKIPRRDLMNLAREQGWARDLAGALRAEVQDRLFSDQDVQSPPELKWALQVQAQAIVTVIREHQGVTQSLRQVISQTLQDIMNPREVLDEKTGELVREYAVALGRSGVPGAIEVLASALERVIRMERQVFGIDKVMNGQEQGVVDQDTGTRVVITIPDNSRGHEPPVSEV
mgnify:CR=1 FL=1